MPTLASTLVDKFTRSAGEPAVHFEAAPSGGKAAWASLTWQEVEARVASTAAALLALGVDDPPAARRQAHAGRALVTNGDAVAEQILTALGARLRRHERRSHDHPHAVGDGVGSMLQRGERSCGGRHSRAA